MPTSHARPEGYSGGVWKSNVARYGISSTYEALEGAKKQHLAHGGTHNVPYCSLVLSQVARTVRDGKFTHTPRFRTSAKQHNFSGTDGRPTLNTGSQTKPSASCASACLGSEIEGARAGCHGVTQQRNFCNAGKRDGGLRCRLSDPDWTCIRLGGILSNFSKPVVYLTPKTDRTLTGEYGCDQPQPQPASHDNLPSQVNTSDTPAVYR